MKDPVLSTIPKMVEGGLPFSYPGPYHAGVGEMQSTFVIPDMLGRVVTDGWEPEKAMDEAYEKAKEIFARHGFG